MCSKVFQLGTVGLVPALLLTSFGHALPLSLPIAEPARVRLVLYDEVGQPGEVVALRAKLGHLSSTGLRVPLRGRSLIFNDPDLVTGRAVTAADGTALLKVRLPGPYPPLYRVQVAYHGSKHHRPAQVKGRLFVWPKESRILITDVDGTISNLSLLRVPFTSNRDTPPVPGSVEALAQLARSYKIIYLTSRDEVLFEKTRAWLREKGFPPGPLFCRDFHLTTDQATFKRQFIHDLRKRYPNVVAGVGDQPSDAKAYLGNGLKTFVLTSTEKKTVPPGTRLVPSWRHVRRQLEAERP